MSGAFADLLGKTLVSAAQTAPDRIEFVGDDGARYLLYHCQDCCESVEVEDICGDLADLVGSTILQAEEAESDAHSKSYQPEYWPENFTWTFYKLATIKGSVTIRWLGESNGSPKRWRPMMPDAHDEPARTREEVMGEAWRIAVSPILAARRPWAFLSAKRQKEWIREAQIHGRKCPDVVERVLARLALTQETTHGRR